AAAWLIAVAVGVNLLPDLTSSPPQGGHWISGWLSRYLLPIGDAGHRPGDWGSEIKYNQALCGAINRCFRSDAAGALDGFPGQEQAKLTASAHDHRTGNAPPLNVSGSQGRRTEYAADDPLLLQRIVYALDGLLLLTALLILSRARKAAS